MPLSLAQFSSFVPSDITLPGSIPAGRAAALACAATLGLLVLKYNDRAIFTERPKGAPFEHSLPLLGSLLDVIKHKDDFHDMFLHLMEKHNTMTIGSSSIGSSSSILTINPLNVEHVLKNNFSNYIKGAEQLSSMQDLFGHGIFTADGEQWRFQRKAASLIFNVANFRDHYVKVFVEEFDVMANNIFDKKASSGKPVDFHDVIYKYTLDSFVLIGFGKKLNSLLSQKKVPFAESFDICQRNCSDRFINPFTDLFDVLKGVFQPGAMRIKDHIQVVDDFTYSLIRERREQVEKGGEFNDLMARFMSARNTQGRPLDDVELRDMILNFIIAGRDTTAQALSWLLYNVLLHPRIEEKLVEEIDRVLPDAKVLDGPELYEVVKKLPYAHAVFYETLRLYPSVPSNGKVAIEDDILPDGAHVKKGMEVSWSPYAMGRSEKVWGPDAKSFVPGRWIKIDGTLRRESQGKFPAFHGGPRVCLGQELAKLEAIVALALILKRYKFSLVPDQKVAYETSLTCPMKNGLHVTVERR
ncbi:cytochrome P450 [Zychaea mexicana]|uniref:cytochrome P450 n=1 Tax=Zychaea mexicana TaxID=64656 RepID=UPI0022FE580D|nr:cytochrome P450 [Zychaea mexicana]KAI9484494.1 cytochrome P450 [Zychaea mexicana]